MLVLRADSCTYYVAERRDMRLTLSLVAELETELETALEAEFEKDLKDLTLFAQHTEAVDAEDLTKQAVLRLFLSKEILTKEVLPIKEFLKDCVNFLGRAVEVPEELQKDFAVDKVELDLFGRKKVPEDVLKYLVGQEKTKYHVLTTDTRDGTSIYLAHNGTEARKFPVKLPGYLADLVKEVEGFYLVR